MEIFPVRRDEKRAESFVGGYLQGQAPIEVRLVQKCGGAKPTKENPTGFAPAQEERLRSQQGLSGSHRPHTARAEG